MSEIVKIREFSDDRTQANYEDARRGEFLRAIDTAAETLSEFEISFVGDFIKERGGKEIAMDVTWFTSGRRQVVDNMIHRYGFRSLKSPSGVATKLPTAATGCCGYLVRSDETNRRVCCGRPATFKSPRGLELCTEHTQTRAAELDHLRKAKERLRP